MVETNLLDSNGVREMIEFLLGIVVGGALVIHAVRRYLNREGKVADLVRRVSGTTKE